MVSADWCGRRRADFRHLVAIKLCVLKEGLPGYEFTSKMMTEALEMSENLWKSKYRQSSTHDGSTYNF